MCPYPTKRAQSGSVDHHRTTARPSSRGPGGPRPRSEQAIPGSDHYAGPRFRANLTRFIYTRAPHRRPRPSPARCRVRAAGRGGPRDPRRARRVTKKSFIKIAKKSRSADSTEHVDVPRIRALREGERSRPSTSTPRARGPIRYSPGPPLGRLVPRSSVQGAGRSEQMRITPHTYIHNLSGNDYPAAALHTSNLCGAYGRHFIGRDPRTLRLSQPSCFTW